MVQGRGEGGDADRGAEAWSALVDGEVDARTAGELVSRWRGDDDAQDTWHAYHLIGDVLRSEDLAGNGRDRAFMQRLQASLALEPTVLAPTVAPADAAQVRAEPARRWAVPLGIAAGVTLVVGTLLVTRMVPQVGVAVLAQADAQHDIERDTQRDTPRLSAAGQGGVASAVATPRLLRDASLDRYLAAHKQYQSANALGSSTGFIRSATYDTAPR